MTPVRPPKQAIRLLLFALAPADASLGASLRRSTHVVSHHCRGHCLIRARPPQVGCLLCAVRGNTQDNQPTTTQSVEEIDPAIQLLPESPKARLPPMQRFGDLSRGGITLSHRYRGSCSSCRPPSWDPSAAAQPLNPTRPWQPIVYQAECFATCLCAHCRTQAQSRCDPATLPPL